MDDKNEKTTNERKPMDPDVVVRVDVPDFIFQQHVWAGETVKPWINHGDVPDENVTPNGIDLTVDKVFITMGNTILTKDRKDTMKAPLTEIETRDNIEGLHGNEGWFLGSGYYTVQWAEFIQIPLNAIGLLSPRSTLLRTCATVYGAVWDRGYHGYGQSGFHLFDHVLLERGTALAQICFVEAMMGEKTYDGQYQGEHVASEEEETKKEK